MGELEGHGWMLIVQNTLTACSPGTVLEVRFSELWMNIKKLPMDLIKPSHNNDTTISTCCWLHMYAIDCENICIFTNYEKNKLVKWAFWLQSCLRALRHSSRFKCFLLEELRSDSVSTILSLDECSTMDLYWLVRAAFVMVHFACSEHPLQILHWKCYWKYCFLVIFVILLKK